MKRDSVKAMAFPLPSSQLVDNPTIRTTGRSACKLVRRSSQTRIRCIAPGWHAQSGLCVHDEVVQTHEVFQIVRSWSLAGYVVRTYPVAQLIS